MMNEKEFYENVKDSIGFFLPMEYAHAQIALTTQVKHNDMERTGISIRLPNETVCPIIYLDDYFRKYQAGTGIDEVMQQIAQVRTGQGALTAELISPGLISDYEQVRPMLQMRAYDTEKNEKRLEGIVHHCFGDYSSGYAIVLNNSPERTMSVMVTPAMLEMWGITKKRLHDDTILSDLSKEPVLMDIGAAMFSVMGEGEGKNYLDKDTPREALGPGKELMCLTNAEKVNGAGLILNSVVQEKIAQVFGGSYFVLPSSIHEVLVLPDDGSHTAKELGMMVHEINATELNPEDILSDKVQIYDVGSRKLVNAVEYEKNHEKNIPQTRGKTM